ncbi:MAG TPA: GNAT family N-acetyltransferase [Gaiellaceae bacterium]|nr:GNAT family N-acetyltransferase [Gaiellaceae bacterium]
MSGAGVELRRATEADEPVLRELWEEFEAELPPPPEYVETWGQEWEDVFADIGGRGVVLLAEDGQGVVGTVRASLRRANEWYIALAYVRPRARGRGVLKELLREAVREGKNRGSGRVTLHVLAANEVGIAVWRRLGFHDLAHYLEAPIDALEARLDQRELPSSGAAYVQTDDRDAVGRAVSKYLPRIGRSQSTEITAPANGWIRVDDDLCSRDPGALRRLGRELSLALGAIVLTLGVEEGAVVRYVLWDRGGVADEYASVPEHHGPLPPGDVVALAANPTVAQRLTGADPAEVRAVARTAASPAELPPPDELRARLADVLGVGSGS